jgi:uncharacterized protein YndB with AHSA1/START domain
MPRTSIDVQVETQIGRPAPAVWEFVSALERLPEWLDEFEKVVKESDGPVGEGTVLRYTISPGHRSSTLRIVEWQPGRRFAWDGPPLPWHGGAARPRGYIEVIPDRDDSTRFVSRYQPELTGTMAVMRPYLAWWVRRQRATDTQRLKELLEGSGP